MPEQQNLSAQGVAPSPDTASTLSDSSTVWSRHADASAPSSSPTPKKPWAQRFRNALADFGKPPTATFDSEHGIKPKTPGTVDTMSRPPRI
ncbi:hypothetical protein PG994_011306 [Apiospora phragmitis]|uniref:Uncharacterized protein n=1 Tax=Apiospora phragmitis TaxID=2905665 RepID=A0ABR1TSF4_9PEZI